MSRRAPKIDVVIEQARSSRLGRWTIVFAGVILLILLPFFLFGDALHGYAVSVISSANQPELLAMLLGTLLASDIVLPVPSSIVSTASGHILGFVAGTAVSTVGMTAGCGIGYAIGRWLGRPSAARLIGERNLADAERVTRQIGLAALAASRPIPVLAEASVLLAGMGAMPPGRFLAVTTLSNLGISLVYCAAGALTQRGGAFLIAFAAAVLIPAAALLGARIWQRWNGRASPPAARDTR